jgi:hypothetical protein
MDAIKNLFTSNAPARSTGFAAAAAATAIAAAPVFIGGSDGLGGLGSFQNRFRAQTARLWDIQRA